MSLPVFSGVVPAAGGHARVLAPGGGLQFTPSGGGTVRVVPPATGTYDWTLPSALPESTSLVTVAATGVLGLVGLSSYYTTAAVDALLAGYTPTAGPYRATGGTVSAPDFSFGGDTDTGVYRAGADSLGLAVGGSKVLGVSKSAFDSTLQVDIPGYLGVGGPASAYRHVQITPAVGKTGLHFDLWQDGTVWSSSDTNGNTVASLALASNSPTLTLGSTAGRSAVVVENSTNGNDGVTLGLDASNRGEIKVNTSSGAASISLNSIGTWHNPSLYVGATSGTVGSKFRVDTGAAATIGAIIRGAASQTANLQEWQDSAGTPVMAVGPTGYIGPAGIAIGVSSPYRITVRGSGDNVTDSSIYLVNSNGTGTAAGAIVQVQAGSTGNTGSGYLAAFGTAHASYPRRVVLACNSDATGMNINAANLGQDIRFTAGSSTERVRISGADQSVLINTVAAAVKGLAVKAAASQTANLVEWQDSAGALLGWIGSTGRIQLVAGASGSSALTTHVSGDSVSRYYLLNTGDMSWSSGSSAADTRLRRAGANSLTLDNGSNGTAHMIVNGTVFCTALSYQAATTGVGATTTSPATLSPSWATADHATRKGRLIQFIYDTTAREAWRIESNGSAPMIGFLGATAVARQTVGAAATGGSTVDAEARASLAAIRTALINLGLAAA